MENLFLTNAMIVPPTRDLVPSSSSGFAGGRRMFFSVKLAVAASIVLHMLFAFVLVVQPLPSTGFEKHQTLPAIFVTWVDSLHPEEKRHNTSFAVQKPAAVVARREKPPAVTPVAPAPPPKSAEKSIESVEPVKIIKPVEPDVPVNSIETVDSVEAANPEPVQVVQEAAVASPASVQAASGKEMGIKGFGVNQTQVLPAGGGGIPASYTTKAKPRYRDNAPPVYPSEARLKGQEGVVLIRVEILPNGRTGEMKIKTSSGYYALDRSAIKAVKAWKFEPAQSSGEPVTAWVDIPVRFVLQTGK